MTVEEAILAALEHERRVRDHYVWAAEQSKDEKGKHFFEVLAKEEQGHVDYLESRLAVLKEGKELDAPPLETLIPSKNWVAEGAQMLKESAEKREYQDDYRRLFTALKLEEEVSAFYKELVATLEDPTGKKIFSRFLEIEDGHTAIVQAEVDVMTKTGYFYEFQEFNLEE